MKTRKPLCLLLVTLLGVSFFASGAAASSCKETNCSTIVMPAQHHHGGAVRIAVDCCTGFAQKPCELGPRQVELAVLWISSGRLHSYRPAVFSPTLDHFDFSFLSRAVILNAAAGAPGRSSAIYLENMTLMC